MLSETASSTSSTSPGLAPASPGLRALIWGEAAFLLALAQMLWAGYHLGAGNQSIQIPLLQRLHDASLYPRDAMVNGTLVEYPSYFFAGLAWALTYVDLPALYLGLHIAAAAGVFLAVAALCRWLFNDELAGLIAALVLLAGHLHALAGETLYSTGFTHTWATFPLALAVLALYARGWVVAALALAGLLFNLHALTAAYVLAMVLGAEAANAIAGPWRHLECGGSDAALAFRGANAASPQAKAVSKPPQSKKEAHVPRARFLVGLLAFFLLASPMLVMMLRHRQDFDATWLTLMHVRSADHSFPSSWWQAGALDVPRFAMIVALGVLAMSQPLPVRARRMLLGIGLATGAMFLAGYLFTEVWPVPLVVRAQLFRASRLVVVLAVALAGYGFVQALKSLGAPAGRYVPAVLELISWTLALTCLAIPGLLVFLPWAVLLATLTALAQRRLAWWQAATSAAALLIALAAWRTIHFGIPGLGHWPAWTELGGALAGRQGAGLVAALTAAAGMVWWVGVSRLRTARRIVAGVALPLCIAALVMLWPHWTAAAPDDWAEVQAWARRHTPTNAVFLTPASPGGFRINSQRSVVGEWRDGTQLYFSAGFAPTWWQRMNDLQPGQVLDSAGTTLLSRGKPLGACDDQQIIELAQRYQATHVVLPADGSGGSGGGGDHHLVRVYSNADWAVYEPRLPVPVIDPNEDPLAADERFIRQVVLPNIEKHRKSEVRIQVLDPTGRPINDADFAIQHVRHHFGFGCSLPFFTGNDKPSYGDFKPPPVKPVELERFGELFNFSLIPFSSKWMYTEAVEGQTDYSELDRYVQWCADHQVSMEFHFLSGYLPGWLRKRPEAEQGQRFLEHARDVVGRYADRIEYFQVVNEKILIRQSPAVFKMIREMAPQAKLGISDCARFYPEESRRRREQPQPQQLDRDLFRGLEEVKWLKQQGVKLDYFGYHGHRPFGLWAAATEIYRAMDTFAAQDVRLHITEFGMPLNKPMVGPLRQDEPWTEQEQARYYERFYTIIFSHPAVDVLNLWLIGPESWMPQSGLLDKDYQPKPAFEALRKLIRETWSTRAAGRLGLDGTTAFRGYHGDYTLTLRWRDGRVATTTFSVTPGQSNVLRFTLDATVLELKAN
ncbi:MAG: endo-1,4-beta-xylanase [Phycisphaeraceae bacterium]